MTDWIPVSERLPNIGERVLVSYDTYDELDLIDITHYDKYGFLIGTVNAWMPLPEPYHGGDENDNTD